MSRRVTMILRILITESQSSKELEMPEKTGSTWEQREYNNDLAQIHGSGGRRGRPSRSRQPVMSAASGARRSSRGCAMPSTVRSTTSDVRGQHSAKVAASLAELCAKVRSTAPPCSTHAISSGSTSCQRDLGCVAHTAARKVLARTGERRCFKSRSVASTHSFRLARQTWKSSWSPTIDADRASLSPRSISSAKGARGLAAGVDSFPRVAVRTSRRVR